MPAHDLRHRILGGVIAIGLVLAVGCGKTPETEQVQPADENLGVRQEKMKQISALCVGIMKILKDDSVGNVAGDARQLKAIMAEAATIPPPFDTEKYKFYAADFQTKADALAKTADAGSVDESKPAFKTLTETCGVCHYTCKYPVDL